MPAPTRIAATKKPFPGRWGYGVSLALIIAGLVVGGVLIVRGLQGWYDDVRALQRNVADGELIASLERGEYFLYDEDGIDLGPFDIRVTRASDNAVMPTGVIVDGVTYDVDGHDGRARLRVQLPTDDFYRFEVTTGPKSIARFALGGPLADGRRNAVVQGLVIGGLAVLGGLGLLVLTLVRHARWGARQLAVRHVGRARSAVASTAESAGLEPAAVQQIGTAREHLERVSGWSNEKLASAREKLDSLSADGSDTAIDHGSSPTLRRTLSDRAGVMLDSADNLAAEADKVARSHLDEAGAQLESSGLDLEKAGQAIDTAMARVEERLRAGDRVADIARDERMAAHAAGVSAAERARETAAKLADQSAVALGDFDDGLTALVASGNEIRSELEHRSAALASEMEQVAATTSADNHSFIDAAVHALAAEVGLDEVGHTVEPGSEQAASEQAAGVAETGEAVESSYARKSRAPGLAPPPRAQILASARRRLPMTDSPSSDTSAGESQAGLHGGGGLKFKRFEAIAPAPSMRPDRSKSADGAMTSTISPPPDYSSLVREAAPGVDQAPVSR